MRYRWYAFLVLVLGTCVAAKSQTIWQGDWTIKEGVEMALVLALVALSKGLPLKLSPQSAASLMGAPLLLGVLILSPIQAAIGAGAGSLVADWWLRRKAFIGAFNAGAVLWATASASALFHVLNPENMESLLAPRSVGSAALAGILLQGTSLILVAGMVSLQQATSFWTTWRKTWVANIGQDVGVLVVGYAGSILAQQAAWAMLLLAVPLALASHYLDRGMAETQKSILLARDLVKSSLADRNRANEAAQWLSRQNDLILNSAGEGILGVDNRGVVTFANPAAARLLGTPAGCLIGLPIHAVIHGAKDVEQIHRPDECLLSSFPERPDIHGANEVFVRRGGTSFPVEFAAASIRQSGMTLGAVITFQDISERVQLQQQLLQAQKMESIGRLAGGVAHDFNNLLTPIVGYAELAQLGLPAGHGAKRHLEEISKAAERASKLTHQLLAFSRHDLFEPKVVDVREVVLEMDGMLRRLLGEDIELVALPAASRACARVDQGQMEQVLANLAINARDAMPDGGKLIIETGTFLVRPGETPPASDMCPGSYVVVRVIDNGQGMDQYVKAHLFEPFFTTKERGKGTGLGLATCYGIIKQHGGSIAVRSDPGKGSTFSVYLPQVIGMPSSGHTEPNIGTVRGGSETILVVEDEPQVLRLASEVLQQQGYSVLGAGTGADALWIAREWGEDSIDLLLTDMVMPQMSGPELATSFTRRFPRCKVLLMTGYPAGSGAAGTEARSFPLLAKPFPPTLLAQKVREVLDGK